MLSSSCSVLLLHQIKLPQHEAQAPSAEQASTPELPGVTGAGARPPSPLPPPSSLPNPGTGFSSVASGALHGPAVGQLHIAGAPATKYMPAGRLCSSAQNAWPAGRLGSCTTFTAATSPSTTLRMRTAPGLLPHMKSKGSDARRAAVLHKLMWCTCGGARLWKLAGNCGLQSGSCPGLQQTSRAPTCMPGVHVGSVDVATLTQSSGVQCFRMKLCEQVSVAAIDRHLAVQPLGPTPGFQDARSTHNTSSGARWTLHVASYLQQACEGLRVQPGALRAARGKCWRRRGRRRAGRRRAWPAAAEARAPHPGCGGTPPCQAAAQMPARCTVRPAGTCARWPARPPPPPPPRPGPAPPSRAAQAGAITLRPLSGWGLAMRRYCHVVPNHDDMPAALPNSRIWILGCRVASTPALGLAHDSRDPLQPCQLFEVRPLHTRQLGPD